MNEQEQRTAWIGASLLAAGFLAIWFFPTEFELGVFPGAGTEAPSEEPSIPPGVFGITGLVLVLGIGLVWYLPWLGRRLASLPGRLALGAACVLLGLVGFGGIPALVAGAHSVQMGAQNYATFLLLLGAGLIVWLAAATLGFIAVFRKRRPALPTPTASG